MDDENKPDQQNTAGTDSQPENDRPSHEHVHIFGAEVNGGGEGATGAAKTTSETKEEWRARKRERRAQWRAQREEWRQARHHEGGMFWGLILLLVGVFALLGTFGYLSPVFWSAIVPFWPILLILWGASLVLGRHWFARFILFIFALIFLIVVILYGLVRAGSPLVSSLSPNVVRAVQTAQPPQY